MASSSFFYYYFITFPIAFFHFDTKWKYPFPLFLFFVSSSFIFTIFLSRNTYAAFSFPLSLHSFINHSLSRDNKTKEKQLSFICHRHVLNSYVIFISNRRVISSRASSPTRRGRTSSGRRASPTPSDSDSRASSRTRCSRSVTLSRTTSCSWRCASTPLRTWPSNWIIL